MAANTHNHLQKTMVQFEHAKDSVMTRTMEGRINFWNRSAEQLYGWGKEDAVGSISHDLLRTQFPKPLEEIESELVQRGTWEGKLVHSTRAGGQVVVQSRWILRRNGEPESVLEINACSPDGKKMDPQTCKDTDSVENARQHPSPVHRLAKPDASMRKVPAILLLTMAAVCILAIWTYALFGHDVLKSIYEGKFFGIDTWAMKGKLVTPVENYYAAADALMVKSVHLMMLLVPIVIIFLKEPVGVFLAGFSLTLFSFLVFCLLEAFPSLIVPLRMDILSTYYAYKIYYIPDDVLGWRGKPLAELGSADFKDDRYSSVDSTGAPPPRIDWKNDENGFRNGALESSYDVVITGDSFMAFGESEADTFPKRLEKHSNGLTVMNLGIGGYGPFQYFEALKTYGLSKRPKYVFFAFYSGNDLHDIRSYVHWKNGQGTEMYRFGKTSFLEGYRSVLRDLLTGLNSSTRALTRLVLERSGITGGYPYTPPNVAVLDLGVNRRHQILFVDRVQTETIEEIKRSDEWVTLRSVLSHFKDVCERNGITAITIYVPSATEIYAKYSTDESGAQWRSIMDRQIAAGRNLEMAFGDLSRELNIKLINLSPVFHRAAENGEMLYYSVDSHWNANGREVAARYVAEHLTGGSFRAAHRSQTALSD